MPIIINLLSLYIILERPLLVYNTKFDIRAYFLMAVNSTGTYLDIWCYKNCFLRFSTQEFDLKKLDESVHLTNVAVQKVYQISPKRDKNLPTSNVWSLDQFKAYLKQIDQGDIWDSKIYPGIRKNVVGMILCAIDETDLQKNCFELYGCDFMITDDFEPIFIEINYNANMMRQPYTNIHYEVQEDTMKGTVFKPLTNSY